MCNVWKNPTVPQDEITLETMAKLPDNIDALNMTGGEPTLRNDLSEIADLLYPKARKFEISSNGLHSERIEPIIKKYPDVKIRFSLEGFEEKSNLIRGEKGGFQKKVAGLRRLKELGGTDLGFALTIQDDNADDLVELFRFAQKDGFELSTSTLHNGFQFHKTDNAAYDRIRVAHSMEKLIIEQLKTYNVKNWFRAYLDLGLVARVLGNDRLLPCPAGTDILFVDPWSDVYGCNVRPDLKMGNLADQSWDEIYNGPVATEVRKKVAQCKQNCWMVGSAKTAMRHPKFTKLPRWTPFAWVLENKIRLMLGRNIDFKRYVDYSRVNPNAEVAHRIYYLDQPGERKVQRKDDVHYVHLGNYDNR